MAWGILGALHLVASAVLVLTGSQDSAVIWSQFIGGLVEIALAFYFHSLEV
jgi:hypothetical protein